MLVNTMGQLSPFNVYFVFIEFLVWFGKILGNVKKCVRCLYFHFIFNFSKKQINIASSIKSQ